MTRLIVLDRDGIINKDSLSYIKSVDEFILIPGSAESIARLTASGYTVAVATNQSGVSRGLYTEEVLRAIHQKMVDSVQAVGGSIDAIEYCIHLPSERCYCRKPNPGMLLAIAKQFNCSLKNVPFVGDRISDIKAAYAAGASPVMVISSMTELLGLKAHPDIPVFNSLTEYVNHLLLPL
ncbi:D-glycero-beta-D-manno-heptose 1,7-bisphosphate 7-phosphatase [uncultured Legionella sp.]|uniref:D-glycero-beta-D-manno-heptose 1,7-bisphosphate 7-phosphatase n=1 Tax=uncultured Legionella sp. TaxID=210934 RepID=UPI002636833A|nr:D-glycero-beta-D-manno-heptose 1,7-bisphosphate 7-phosphatase [uncultured Legionella sp.]